MVSHILSIFYGMVFGIANVIPGVSGGTMLVVFGCYDKVCGALALDFKEIKKNLVFLIFFGIGALIGILGFSFVITWLFGNFPVATNMFFMGLIVGSVPLIIRYATVNEKFRPVCIIPFILGLALVVGLAVAENVVADPYSVSVTKSGAASQITIINNSDKTVDGWEIELTDDSIDLSGRITGAEVSTHYSTVDKIKNIFGIALPETAPNMITNSEGGSIAPHDSYTFTYDGEISADNTQLSVSYAMDAWLFVTMMAALFVAAVAMIIPGVSGSFVMVLLGVYPVVIGAINSLDFMIIIPCAIGAIIGIVSGAKLITTLMKKYSLMVYSVILGLVAGSLYAILPDGFGFNMQTLMGVFAFVAGGAVAFFAGKSTKTEKTEKKA